MVDPGLLEEVLHRLAAGGVDFAEVYAQASTKRTASLETGASPTVSREADGGVSLLVERAGLRQFQILPTHAPSPLLEAAARLADGLEAAKAFPGSVAGGSETEPESAQTLEGLLRAGEESARASDPRVFRYEGVAVATDIETLRVDTEGRSGARRERQVTLYHLAYARGRSKVQGGARTLRIEGGVPSPEAASDAAAEAARGATTALEALPPPEGAFPVVLSPQASGLLLHEAVGRLLEGDVVTRDLSPFAGRLGERVGSGLLTLAQEPSGTDDVDDEGFPVTRAVLLENGMLCSFLADRRTACCCGIPRTGNGRRTSFRHEPLTRTYRLAAAQGEGTLQALLEGVELGLFVARLGAGEVEGVSGRFRFPAAEAFLVREGVLSEPLRGAALEGLSQEFLMRVKAAGGRREIHPGVSRKMGQAVPVWDQAPALLVDPLTIRRTGP